MRLSPSAKPFRPRSFVRRDSRRTPAQIEAYNALWPHFGLSQDLFDCQHVFGRQGLCFLEIGFGGGQSLLALAKAFPETNFIGIETYKSGIGRVLMGIQAEKLTNLRIYYGDAVEILENCLPDASLDGILIFFPDPWQKRRHHTRRLIQTEFMQLVIRKCKKAGDLHFATDWDDYGKHMLKVLSLENDLINMAGENQFAERSCYRPTVTKFEQRAKKEGRSVWELQFKKIPLES